MKGFSFYAAPAALMLVAGLCACDRSTPYETNLLRNGSFEEVGRDGVPRGWELVLFKGSPQDPVIRYGADTLAVDGKRSWMFQGDPGTRRFYSLQQEVKVKDVTHVRVRGWILGDGVRLRPGQNAMCNFFLTFYDKDHNRFQMERHADRRTPLRSGTYPWEEQVYSFPIPKGTRYVAVSCLLAMNGQAWFDNVSLDVPRPQEWETKTTKNYVFHWLPGHPMPEGAPEEQQGRFDYVGQRLGVESDAVINYYYYPDSLTIRRMTGVKGVMYVSWDDYDFHTIQPSDDHELVHFITDSIGRPPRSIAEGTVYWLQDRWGSAPLDDQLRRMVQLKKVTPLTDLFEQERLVHVEPEWALTTATAFVKFVEARWGGEKLLELYRAINGFNAYLPVASGFEAVYRVPLADAEKEFHQWLQTNYGA